MRIQFNFNNISNNNTPGALMLPLDNHTIRHSAPSTRSCVVNRGNNPAQEPAQTQSVRLHCCKYIHIRSSPPSPHAVPRPPGEREIAWGLGAGPAASFRCEFCEPPSPYLIRNTRLAYWALQCWTATSQDESKKYDTPTLKNAIVDNLFDNHAPANVSN